MPASTNRARSTEVEQLHLAEVLSALSYALDLTEGQPAGHCIRSCWIAVNTAIELDLRKDQQRDVYYTTLLKDAGCSSNAARLCALYGADDRATKKDFKTVDNQRLPELAKFVLRSTGLKDSLYRRFQRLLLLLRNGDSVANELVSTRCERGSQIALEMGFRQTVADGIYSLDEHWNGKGRPHGIKGNKVPIASQLALLGQVVDVFQFESGAPVAIAEVQSRRETWFSPEVVTAFERACQKDGFWQTLADDNLESIVNELEPGECTALSGDRLNAIARAFASVIDAKSPFTAGHSRRVALYSIDIGRSLGFDAQQCDELSRAALLHDIGKLGVSNEILDKPGKLTEEEWLMMRKHPIHSQRILERLTPFREIALIAGCHHERLDGKGYPAGIAAEEISPEARIITISDIFDAITADRPYRRAMPLARALEVLESMRGHALDPQCLDALRELVPQWQLGHSR